MDLSVRRERFNLSGQVQGVGFRPYVYRLARSMNLAGFVINDGSGAQLEVQGPAAAIDDFARRLLAELPPLAQVRECRRAELPALQPNAEPDFHIRASVGGEMTDAQVTVDTAACPDCLRELAEPSDPRHRYPFINCTNCGPRYSIIRRIPYDRPNTTMADFAMCRLCGGQYADPGDRRFHAQPIACPKCGPGVWLVDAHGRQVECDDPIESAIGLLRSGRILAIKGLGGFHLACRADSDHAVRRLRMRKNRDAKPFALMVRDLDQARRIAHVSPEAQALLAGPQAPIVLLPRLPGASELVADAVAPNLDTLGVMLPYTPLHRLLFAADLPPLVMTSGNVADEPLIRENEDAVAHLGRIADTILLHNRRIQRSLDDSIVQMTPAGRPAVLRRARGYAPQPVVLGQRPSPVILAVGGELKSAVCLYKDGRAVLSEHIGDLKDGRVYRRFMQVIADLESLFDLRPEIIVADLHPHYLSTQYAMRRAAGELAGHAPLPLLRVQHHHAHIVACMAENGVSADVIGLACDGTGYGEDGAIWGCEILRAGLDDYERLGHLRYYPSPGGDAAALEPYRPAMALLHDTYGKECLRLTIIHHLGQEPDRLKAVIEQIRAGANAPPTSSLGRLFDAVSGLAGMARVNRYEGEAPMLLEAAVDPSVEQAYPFEVIEGEPFRIDYRPMIRALVDDLDQDVPPSVVAAKFHNTVVAFLTDGARRASAATGLRTVALSGGCFCNMILRGRLESRLAEEGFRVLTHETVPCNDGCVALGQAVAAARRLARGLEGRRRDHVPGNTSTDQKR